MASPASPSAALVRPATAADIPHITAIHNHYITNTVTTFRTEPLSEAEVQSAVAASAAAGLPFLVAAAADNDAAHVLGFAYAAGYRTPVRPGYRHTAEMTILLAPAARARGVGTQLMRALIADLRGSASPGPGSGAVTEPAGVKQLLAVMALDVDGRDAGWGLRDWYMRFGFVQAGHLRRVGWKMGRWVDTVIMQLSLDEEEEKGQAVASG